MVENVFCAKEYAKQMRENAVEDNNGNVICSVELWEQIASIIESTADADVVEVVRCKECIHKVVTKDGEYNPEDIVCNYHMSDGFCEKDFCSYGEKMDGKDGAE